MFEVGSLYIVWQLTIKRSPISTSKVTTIPSINRYFNEINWSEEFKEHNINYNTHSFIPTLSSAIDLRLFDSKVNKKGNDKKNHGGWKS